MKKAIALFAVAALIVAAWTVGRAAGIRHAIEDSEIWTVDRYDPENPAASAWNGFDQLIYIELDGQLYEHGMIQG